MGRKVHIFDGDESNFKITTPRDLSLAEQFIKNNH
jgi:2-C-methyl-D-erythritol 4-phosphate cytidylyltransferase